ncbi:MAG: hypothetical protein QOF70_1837 [Acetobacteraceae bacterium]|jgi:hypothetical protein|nr:hypothetical protein [Acetobacteraceae bacterium]
MGAQPAPAWCDQVMPGTTYDEIVEGLEVFQKAFLVRSDAFVQIGHGGHAAAFQSSTSYFLCYRRSDPAVLFYAMMSLLVL